MTKLFFTGKWNIAYRSKSKIDFFDYQTSFSPLKSISGYWFADPMIFENEDKVFLFCEAYEIKNEIGRIGIFALIDGEWQKFRIVMKNDYHMSYPCVFKRKNEIYMIPETSENRTLQLYKADIFPYKWIKIGNLIENVELLDATIYYCLKDIFLIAYEKKQKKNYLNFYKIDFDYCSIKKIGSQEYGENICRPAGYFKKYNGKVIRPSQDCTEMYGKKIIFNECDFEEQLFKDIKMFELDGSKVQVGNLVGVDRIHTYSETDKLEVIDYSVFHFDLLKRFRIMRRKLYKRKRLK